MIVNAGRAFMIARTEAVQALFGGTFYMTLSSDASALAATDTVLPGEQTGNGLGRVAVTAAHTTGQNSWTFTSNFTYTGTTPVSIYKVAIFSAASGGSLIWEEFQSSPTTFNNSGDQASFTISVGPF